MQSHQTLIARLDLSDFVSQFHTYFAREKPFMFNGDRRFYAQILQELDSIPLNAPPPLPTLDTPIVHLQKHSTLQLEAIFTFMQLVRYFLYLKAHITESTPHTKTWLDKILHSREITPYLVDNSMHYINQNECLLLKAGYNQVIKGMVLERSHNGFFYLLPDAINTLKERQNALKDTHIS